MRSYLMTVAAVVIGLSLSACAKEKADSSGTPTEAAPGAVEGAEQGAAAVKLAPDFTLTNIDGEEFTLAQKRGNIVVMDFWATWCKPCVAAMPHMQQLHDDYKDRHVIVTGINVWESEEDADPTAFIRERGYTYSQLMNGEQVAEAFGLTNSIPVFFIIGFDGEILERRNGFREEELPEIRKILDDYLAARGV